MGCGLRYDCAPSLADTNGLGGLAYELPDDIVKGNEDKIDIKGGTLLNLRGLRIGQGDRLEKSLPDAVPEWVQTRGKPNGPPSRSSRRLQNLYKIGTRNVLVLRIVGPDGATSKTEQELSDSVFGTFGDPVNLHTQYAKCSHDQLIFDMANDTACL